MEPEIKIRGYHTDLYQHVNNARYLEFLEEGRWQLLEDYINLEEFMNKGFRFFVVNINISYKSPVIVNDVIVIKSGLGKIGNKSVVFKQQLINKVSNVVCADADITFVIADLNGKPLRVTGELKEKFQKIPIFKG
ncbi:MAG: acyl-CoA thioesterase [Desulfobacula sp.]|uniref:acyl-CoA thioesterase n=1 Tax=Desulfobacula sp. TaxID=2593537 RepID=UPI0025BE56FA|nr:thioesterase family protein [Desulfobacula sp.]MCD4718747.1 acyl-CoA thioesterase [Desulfobacula sp.]